MADEYRPPLSGSGGPATDAQNDPVIDPTKNVLDLVAAAIQRQDDLREMESRHVREVLELRGRLRHEEVKCQENMAVLRAEHAADVRQSEAARLDAIRAVDQNQVQRAAEVQAAQAATLAAQVQTSADTLRNQVQQAAEAATLGLSRALEPIIKDIADLRRAQYEAQGQKAQVGEGRASGASAGLWVGIAIAAAAAMVAAIGTIIVVANLLTSH
jgi:hypothetical protein